MSHKAVLPEDIAEPLGKLSSEITTLSQKLEDEIFRLVVIEKHAIAAVARATKIDNEVMKKRVARIRERRLGVQVRKAA